MILLNPREWIIGEPVFQPFSPTERMHADGFECRKCFNYVNRETNEFRDRWQHIICWDCLSPDEELPEDHCPLCGFDAQNAPGENIQHIISEEVVTFGYSVIIEEITCPCCCSVFCYEV